MALNRAGAPNYGKPNRAKFNYKLLTFNRHDHTQPHNFIKLNGCDHVQLDKLFDHIPAGKSIKFKFNKGSQDHMQILCMITFKSVWSRAINNELILSTSPMILLKPSRW